MTNQILGAIIQGLVYGLMVLGVFITFRILKIPDLTVDGSIVLGMSIAAMFTNAGYPILALFAATIAGLLAGAVTGLLQTKVKVPAILAGILTMSGLYSINLLIMGGKPNISLLNAETIFTKFQNLIPGLDKNLSRIIVALIICALVIFLVDRFFKTRMGLSIRATGDNEDMVRASSINAGRMKLIALAIANGCVALSGAMFSQYMGYADVTSGSGTIVVGFASVIIGEAIFLKRTDRYLTVGFISAIVGSIAYRIIIAIAVKTNLFPSYFLKFVSVAIIVIALAIGPVKDAVKSYANKKRRLKENA